MFEGRAGGGEAADAVPESAPDPAAPVTAAMLRCWIAGLTGLDRRVDDAERVTQLELLERLKSAAAAAQAVVTVDFAASQRAGQIAAGVRAGTAGAGGGGADGGGGAGRHGGGRGRRAGGAGPAGLPVPRRPLPRPRPGIADGAAGHHGRPPGRGRLGGAGPPRGGRVSGGRPPVGPGAPPCLDPADRRTADAELGPVLAGLGDREVEAAA